jgi:hypothetical protein
MVPTSPRWASSLLPGSSVAWTAVMLAGWQMAVSATLWFIPVPTAGPPSLGSGVLASRIPRAAPMVSTATASARPQMASPVSTSVPCPQGRPALYLSVYLLSGSFFLWVGTILVLFLYFSM